MRRRIIFPCIVIALLSAACKRGESSNVEQQAAVTELGMSVAPAQMPVERYISWVEDKEHGLRVEKKIGDLTFSALYKPHEYIVASELIREGLTKEKLDAKMKEYAGLQYFTFRITAEDEQQELLRKGIQTEQEYYSRIEYFSFGMQKDFTLIEGKDTLNCVLYHFERVYGLAPYATMVLGFPLVQKKPGTEQNEIQDKTIGYSDQVFGVGNVYMIIKAEDLKRIPHCEVQ